MPKISKNSLRPINNHPPSLPPPAFVSKVNLFRLEKPDTTIGSRSHVPYVANQK